MDGALEVGVGGALAWVGEEVWAGDAELGLARRCGVRDHQKPLDVHSSPPLDHLPISPIAHDGQEVQTASASIPRPSTTHIKTLQRCGPFQIENTINVQINKPKHGREGIQGSNSRDAQRAQQRQPRDAHSWCLLERQCWRRGAIAFHARPQGQEGETRTCSRIAAGTLQTKDEEDEIDTCHTDQQSHNTHRSSRGSNCISCECWLTTTT